MGGGACRLVLKRGQKKSYRSRKILRRVGVTALRKRRGTSRVGDGRVWGQSQGLETGSVPTKKKTDGTLL